MVLSVGDKIPDIELKTMSPEGSPVSVRTGEALGKGKVVLFAVPGAVVSVRLIKPSPDSKTASGAKGRSSSGWSRR